LEHPTTILSDHKNLTYFRTAQKLNRRQAQWSLFLSEFNLQLVHVPGSQMVQSDALSRQEDHIPENDTDNKDAILLPKQLFVKFIDMSMHDLLAKQIMKEDLVQDAIKALKEKGTPPTKSSLNDWKVENGLLFFNDRCYIPDNINLQRQLVEKYHYSLPGGHSGQWQTTARHGYICQKLHERMCHLPTDEDQYTPNNAAPIPDQI
jgi:RNase H-like domain found in reverse transcriptase